jgi:hypothetical protein
VKNVNSDDRAAVNSNTKNKAIVLRNRQKKGQKGVLVDCKDDKILQPESPKTVLNDINVTNVRNFLSVIQAKIWPKNILHMRKRQKR